MANKRGEPPPLGDFWWRTFLHDDVQRVLRESWNWENLDPSLGSWLHHAFDAARAFSERPSKYRESIEGFLSEFDWKANEWFFRLCAAICRANQTPPSLEEKIEECYARRANDSAEFIGWSSRESEPATRGELLDLKSVAQSCETTFGIRTTPEQISTVMSRVRSERERIRAEWKVRHPEFFSPRPRRDVPGLES